MLPYYIFLAVIMALYAIYQRDRTNKVALAATAVVFIAFAGLRDSTVGTDTGGYTRSFKSSKLQEVIDDISVNKEDPLAPPNLEGDTLWEKLTDEPGFYYLKVAGRLLGDNYAILLLLVALIVCIGTLGGIHLVSQHELVSLFVFITLGLYTFSFNAERQGIAVAIYCLAIPYLIKRDLLRYTLVVAVAAMFHRTIVVTLPLYFLFTMRFSPKSVLFIVAGIGVLTAFMPFLIDFGSTIEYKYRVYTYNEQSTGRGLGLTAFYTVLAVFFVWWRQFMDRRLLRRYDVFLHMIICAAVIYLVVAGMGLYVETNRFANYLQIAAMFLWADVFANPKHRPSWAMATLFVVGHLIYFYIFTDRMASLTPYMWNETIFGVQPPY